MQLYDFPGDVKAEAHAGQVTLAVSLVKTVEDGLTLVGGNAHTLIGHGKPDAAITASREFNCHDAALRAELDGIVN